MFQPPLGLVPGGGGGGALDDHPLLSKSPGGGGGADRGPIKGRGGRWGLNMRGPPPVLCRQACLSSLAGGGAGPSPNSAIRDMYSSSIADLGPDSFHPPDFLPKQSLAMWPIPPQDEHTTLLVTLGLSWHCHAL